MIVATNLRKQFGDRVLFENASFSLGPGERLGLVGRNGTGKSTLFMMITGEEPCDTGKIVTPKDYKIGHLDQMPRCEEPTVLEEGCRGLAPEEKDDTWKVKKILSGLGFSEDDFGRPPSEFSGGYQMRIALARLMVSGPDLLLLDEPTNFLDILSIRWLTGFLRSWPGELMIISHDRAFMDNIITHTMGIHREAIRKIAGSTDRYYRQILAEEEVHERRRSNDEKIRKKEEEFINRFRAKARRASQAQSRIKRLEKMKLTDRLESIENLDFSFDYSPCPGKNIMTVDNLSFSYSGSAPYLIDSFSFTLHASDKICIIGRNGAGKSTLLRLLNGKLPALIGEVKTHPRTKIASFDQADAANLHAEHTIEEEILSSLPVGDRGKARSICGTMLFSQDNALKRIAILSGGEKCRVMLGKAIAAPANLLMLDEPTHHLDMESCHAIIHSLREFEGAALIVTHDEYFLREVATKLIVLQGDQVRLFLGTYDEFLEQVGWMKEEQRKKNQETVKTVNKAERRREKAARRELYNKTVKPLKRETERLEKEIAAMEEDHTRITRELITASEEQVVPDILRLNRELAELERQTEQKYEDYYRVHAEYEDRLAGIES
jgi:ATP-binding cassette, subfamily F, member 3